MNHKHYRSTCGQYIAIESRLGIVGDHHVIGRSAVYSPGYCEDGTYKTFRQPAMTIFDFSNGEKTFTMSFGEIPDAEVQRRESEMGLIRAVVSMSSAVFYWRRMTRVPAWANEAVNHLISGGHTTGG